MSNICIVTDSCALFSNWPALQSRHLTVVPNTLHLMGAVYYEGVDLNAEEALRLMGREQYPPRVSSPGVGQYLEVYTRLAATADGIISIHPSRKLFPSWENARQAARQLGGHCPIEVIDSQHVSAGQGLLVQVALKALEQGVDFEELVRQTRGAAERIYSIFYVESVDTLLQNKIMSSSHAILGAMLGIKPFLALEEGALRAVEKVRTRTQAVERLVEFVVEFMDIEEVIILQPRQHISEQARMLQDRLALEFPGRHFPYALYSPSLASLLGLDATGIVILESEMEDFEDGF